MTPGIICISYTDWLGQALMLFFAQALLLNWDMAQLAVAQFASWQNKQAWNKLQVYLFELNSLTLGCEWVSLSLMNVTLFMWLITAT